MIAAAGELLTDPDVSLVQLDGPALDKDASQGLAEASLERLAGRYKKVLARPDSRTRPLRADAGGLVQLSDIENPLDVAIGKV